jgi:hypothetical protein
MNFYMQSSSSSACALKPLDVQPIGEDLSDSEFARSIPMCMSDKLFAHGAIALI